MNFLKGVFKNPTLVLVIGFILAGAIGYGAVTALSSRNSAPTCSHKQDVCVGLYQDKASPDTITVKTGGYVQFNSADKKSHELALGEGGKEHHHQGKFESGTFNAGEAWRVQFTQDGSFYFHDHFNPKVNILVVVYTPGKDYKIK